MCQFFSLISDGKGKIYYFDWELREKCLSGELKLEPDSHTSIADHFGFKGKEEDTLNKYEYNPLTKKFQIDKLNNTDDSENVRKQCLKLNFKKIIPQLIIKPIVHPFNDIPEVKKVTIKDIELLKQWNSMWNSMWNSVWISVEDSAGISVGNFVGISVEDSAGNSVRNSVRISAGNSAWISVRNYVGAYIGSFFTLQEWKYIKCKKGIYPYQCAVDLWMKGLVPSYDGKIWRLHTGKDAKIIYESGENE